MVTAVLFSTCGRNKRRESAHALARVDTGFKLGPRSYRSGATVDLVQRCLISSVVATEYRHSGSRGV
jgi:hypothetical protein